LLCDEQRTTGQADGERPRSYHKEAWLRQH